MNKAILLSIQPQHVVNILNGDKTLELRKRVPKDFKGWVYIYCTKAKPKLGYGYCDGDYESVMVHKLYDDLDDFDELYHSLNGKVVAKFWFNEYDIYEYTNVGYPDGYENYDGVWIDTTKKVKGYWLDNKTLDKLCLDYDNIIDYGKGKDLYAWHIKDLKIFDTPLELSELGVKRAPQSYMYVEVGNDL